MLTIRNSKYHCLIVLLDLAQESVTSLLGISEQHGSVLLVENWIVHGSIAHPQGSFHHDDLQTKVFVKASNIY